MRRPPPSRIPDPPEGPLVRHLDKHRARPVAAGLVATLTAAIAVTTWANQAAGGQSSTVDSDRTVTLVTGDRVTVGRGGTSVRVEPADGRDSVRFTFHRDRGQTYVIPLDAVGLIAAGTVDRRLFNVDALLEFGYGDAGRAGVPVIVRYRHDRARAAVAGTGARVTRELPAIDGQAVEVGKTHTAAFWTGLRGNGPATLAAGGGVANVWLDGMRRPMLDHSVPQVGAPAAWQAGYTGGGVTVAVLDTGVDASHPDLAGKVVAAHNFSGDPTGADTVGHGTHVASIIAGTGAASGGTYRGVAPGATLLDGKVCAEFGCPESAILAGMQWAAVDKRAKVVNMSLGGPDSAAVDPVEEAVNRISAEQGTLFVVAAGNAGECGDEDRVGSPGSAGAALTVGSVGPDDELSEFSCTGPTAGAGLIKPDITAPGDHIAAARVVGSPVGDFEPVDDDYARVSGTSMSAPHVAGAAAILAQRRPGWNGGQLKATLMGAARPNPALDPFAQGAGRLDVAAALDKALTADPPSVSFGVQRWPHTDDEPIVRPVTLHNATDTALDLTLRPELTGPTGRPAPAGMVRLSAEAVTVPPRGTATVHFTADTRVAGPDGRYTGRVVASGGGEVTVVPIAVEREVESYDLTIRHIDRQGTPAAAVLGFVHTQRPIPYLTGSVTMRLPRGDYPVVAFVDESPAVSMLAAPKVALTRDTTLTLDARTAKPIRVTPPRSSVRFEGGVIGMNVATPSEYHRMGVIARTGYDGLFMGNVGPAGDPAAFVSYVRGDWREPGAAGDFVRSPHSYHLAWFERGRAFDGLVREPRDSELARVHASYLSPAGRLGRKVATAAPSGDPEMEAASFIQVIDLPFTRTEYYTTEGTMWSGHLQRFRPADDGPVREGWQSSAWRTPRPGSSTEQWGAGVFGPALPAPENDQLWVRQFSDGLNVQIPMFSDSWPGHAGYVPAETAWTKLYRDGRQVAESAEAGAVFYPAPAAAARYRVDTELTQRAFDTSTKVTASWWFRSGPVTGTAAVPLGALAVRFSPTLDAANRAPGGIAYLIPIAVDRHPGAAPAEVTSLTVDVSYDDGRTWRKTRVQRTEHGWVAAVRHPDRGFVSLRTEAVDTTGGGVRQTIIRAYGLRHA
jgi:subtilisin family serine protease